MDDIEKTADQADDVDVAARKEGVASSPMQGTDAQPTQSLHRPRTRAEADPAFLVAFEPNDVADPRNLSSARKAGLTFVLGLLALTGSLGSAIVVPAEPAIAADLGMTAEKTVLLMALFLLGFALGPLVWAPVSEAYGRRLSILPAVAVLGVLSIGTATSHTAAGVLATRFLGGVFGSAPISNVTAALGDLYRPRTRGVAMAFYSVCVIGGPGLAPVIGAALTYSHAVHNWRWTEYVEAILAFTMTALAALVLPETYAPVLLARRAASLRQASGDARWWHPHDFVRITPRTVMTKHLGRPLRMFCTEPAVAAVALYASFVYGLLFLTLEVFPLVFRDHRHLGAPSKIVPQLPFLGVFIGSWAGVTVNIANQPRYQRELDRNGGRAVPEARLPPIFLGGVLLVVGLFWFGWTALPPHPWILPTIAGGFIGAGFNIIFQQCINYLVDTYGTYAASATSANTVLRSCIACGLPLAAKPMFTNLGVGPAASVLGAIACVALPLPLVLMRYGAQLRARSKFTG